MSSTRVVVHLANHVGAICITESLSTRKFSLVLAIVENMSILTSSEHASMNVYRGTANIFDLCRPLQCHGEPLRSMSPCVELQPPR